MDQWPASARRGLLGTGPEFSTATSLFVLCCQDLNLRMWKTQLAEVYSSLEHVCVWGGGWRLDLRWPQGSCCGCWEPAGLGSRSSSAPGWLACSCSIKQTLPLICPVGPSGMQRVTPCGQHSHGHLCLRLPTQGAGERF